jgi:hypothetical protein
MAFFPTEMGKLNIVTECLAHAWNVFGVLDKVHHDDERHNRLREFGQNVSICMGKKDKGVKDARTLFPMKDLKDHHLENPTQVHKDQAWWKGDFTKADLEKHRAGYAHKTVQNEDGVMFILKAFAKHPKKLDNTDDKTDNDDDNNDNDDDNI